MTSIEEKQEKIKALAKEGKTLDAIKKIFNVEDRPSPTGRRWMSLVEVIYLDITEKNRLLYYFLGSGGNSLSSSRTSFSWPLRRILNFVSSSHLNLAR